MQSMYNKLQAELLSDAALQSMQDHKLSPKPDNYRLWFEYAGGKKQDLNAEIDELARQQAAINEALCIKLYQKYLATGDRQDLDEARLVVRNMLDVMINHLRSWDTSTSKFCDALHKCTQKLSEDPSIEDIKEIIAVVTQEAESIRTANVDIHSTLDSLTEEIVTLRHDVDQLGSQVVTDCLTGIANRRGFDSSLQQLTQHAVKSNQKCALILADIDHFKKINDQFGHPVGDKVLRFIANTMKSNIRDDDELARYGGEEFAIILPNTNIEGAVRVAEKISKSISSRQLTTGSNSQSIGRITLSAGVAVYQPREALADFVDRADRCLYAAKNAGRNQIKTEKMLTNMLAR